MKKGFMVVELIVIVAIMSLFGYMAHEIIVGEPCNVDNVCGGR